MNVNDCRWHFAMIGEWGSHILAKDKMKKKRYGYDRNGGGFFPLTQKFVTWLSRPILLAGLLLSIPAFYLLLDGEGESTRLAGHALYAVSALLMSVDTFLQWRKHRHQQRRSGKMMLDIAIIVACLVSSFPSELHWGVLEWLLRLGLCSVILLRIAMLVLQYMKPSYLIKLIFSALFMLTSAGAGFYWLEPTVLSYADGVWLAFSTVATVGYGDIVPSTAASKIFAVFIVLLGYAMFSIVTANIAALFVGEEEAGFERELHGDIRALHQEVAALRRELRAQDAQMSSYIHDAAAKNDAP